MIYNIGRDVDFNGRTYAGENINELITKLLDFVWKSPKHLPNELKYFKQAPNILVAESVRLCLPHSFVANFIRLFGTVSTISVLKIFNKLQIDRRNFWRFSMNGHAHIQSEYSHMYEHKHTRTHAHTHIRTRWIIGTSNNKCVCTWEWFTHTFAIVFNIH